MPIAQNNIVHKIKCRYRICTLCSDATGAIPIILKDLAVRKITGKTIFEVTLDATQVFSYLFWEIT